MVEKSVRTGLAQMMVAFWVLLSGFFFSVLVPEGGGVLALGFLLSAFILYLGYRSLVPASAPEALPDQPSRMP